jgi:hypothetical protein
LLDSETWKGIEILEMQGVMSMEQTWNENWRCLRRFLPAGWEEKARELGAWRRQPRAIDSTESLLRLLLIHLADGCSLREAVVRARRGGIAAVSDVALLKRLRASGEWLRWMAVELLQRHGTSVEAPDWLSAYRVRVVDASVVCEPGSTGTDWRIHYSLRLFGLQCDEFHLTGPQAGENFSRFQIASGDLMLGDRAYGHLKGFRHVLAHEGHFLSRLKSKAFGLRDRAGQDLSLNQLLEPLDVGEVGDWAASGWAKGQTEIPLRLCAIRLSEEAAQQSVRRAMKEMKKKQHSIDPDTIALRRYVVVATSLPAAISGRQIMELYRARWQIELSFKRLKSIMGLGHLPKEDEASARSWLQGKMLVACLAQAIVEEGRSFSPWGYPI